MTAHDEKRLRELFDTLFAAHPWHGIDPGPPGGAMTAYIEIVPTDAVKYELDKRSGALRIDRPQRYSSLVPMPYGFLPQTYCGQRVAARCAERQGAGAGSIQGDHDPMDVCVLTEKTLAHGNFLAQVRPIGGLRMIDGNEADDKIVAVLEKDLAYGHLHELSDCPAGIVDRLKHYFLTYKQLPGEGPRKVQIAEQYDRAEAVEVIGRSLADYRDEFGEPEGRLAALRGLLR
ncbi:MAG: inorganic pyrophosphatase [Myxococcales bacterium]